MIPDSMNIEVYNTDAHEIITQYTIQSLLIVSDVSTYQNWEFTQW